MTRHCQACGQQLPVQYPHPDRNNYQLYDDANDLLAERIRVDEETFIDAE